jgi:hypothetical protein
MCFLSGITSYNGTVELEFLPAKFSNIFYYEFRNPQARGEVEVGNAALRNAYVVDYTQPTDICDVDVLAAMFDWPYNRTIGSRYMDSLQHIQQVEDTGCQRFNGHLLLKCSDRCEYRLTAAFGRFSHAVTLNEVCLPHT